MTSKIRIVSIIGALLAPHAVADEQSPSEPQPLVGLRNSWQRAREAALAPIDEKYAKALERLRTRYTKAGDLDSAVAVDQELKRMLSPEIDTSPPQEPPHPHEAPKEITPPKDVPIGIRLPRIRPGRDLKENELGAVRKAVAGSTWTLSESPENTSDYHFDEGGTGYYIRGERKHDSLLWELRPDGTIFVTKAGFHKIFELSSPTEASVTIRATGGAINAAANRKSGDSER